MPKPDLRSSRVKVISDWNRGSIEASSDRGSIELSSGREVWLRTEERAGAADLENDLRDSGVKKNTGRERPTP